MLLLTLNYFQHGLKMAHYGSPGPELLHLMELILGFNVDLFLSFLPLFPVVESQ